MSMDDTTVEGVLVADHDLRRAAADVEQQVRPVEVGVGEPRQRTEVGESALVGAGQQLRLDADDVCAAEKKSAWLLARRLAAVATARTRRAP